MTRTTSAKAYREETENGNITKRQREVFDWLKIHGPATGRQISEAIPGGWKRLAELKTKGYVTESGKVTDCLTGKTAIVWDFCHPDYLLLHTPARKPTRKQLEERLKAAEMALERKQRALDAYPATLHRVI